MCPQGQSPQITVKLTITKTNTPDLVSTDQTIYVKRDEFTKIKSKERLVEFLAQKLPVCFAGKEQYLNFTRKSKKHKDFIPLVSEEDFKSLARSLKVKNHVKLNVSDSSPISDEKSEYFGNPFKRRKSIPIDLAALGDALIEVAVEFFSNSKPQDDDNEQGLDVHQNICCDVCHPHDFVPLKGVRYNCLVCSNFDLCSSCEAKQHLQKSNFGSHCYWHPMAKITYPSSSSFARTDNFGFTQPRPDDIIYDIPLKNCNVETRAKLESLLESKGFEGFVGDVERYISDSEKYSNLCSLLDLDEDDEHVQYLILMSIVEHSLEEMKKESELEQSPEEVEQKQEQEEEDQQTLVDGEIIVRPKKVGEMSRIISLQLINGTDRTIQGGELKFEFSSATQKETVVVKNASDIKPGRIRYYNLGKLAEDFDRVNGMKLTIVGPNATLSGDYNSNTDSILKAKISDNGVEDISSSESPSIINIEKDEPSLNATDEVFVTLVPKSGSLSQLIISNKSSKTIDCTNLKVEVINCFNQPVSSVTLHRKNGILPGKVGKFNFTLVSTHTKYPFELLIENDYNVARCSMSQHNLSGKLVFEETIAKEIDEEGFSSVTESVAEDSNSGLEDEDYDIISGGEEDYGVISEADDYDVISGAED
ncbi:hypothetical protein SBY92_000083 [Candida maltosa Xu316]